MVTQAKQDEKRRTPLSRERVLDAAVALADSEGINAVTMRALAERLGVEAMSLYYHVANKEALFDGIVEVIGSEILEEARATDTPDPTDDWRGALRTRILSAREVMLRHKWAPGVIETRRFISPPLAVNFETIIGIFRQGGFSYDLTHHAMHALGSRALGFAQELFVPSTPDDEQVNSDMMDEMADQFPYMTEMLAEISHDDPDSTIGWCDDQTEFEFSIDLLLNGLESLRLAEKNDHA